MELAQAGSSDLSPSLLTLMQQGSGSLEGSPSAHEAFQRGEQSSFDANYTQGPPHAMDDAGIEEQGH